MAPAITRGGGQPPPFRRIRALAYVAAMHMTTDELRGLLEMIGWSQGDLARAADRDIARTRKMARGSSPIDQPLADWLREVARLLGNPPPKPPRGSDDNAGDRV